MADEKIGFKDYSATPREKEYLENGDYAGYLYAWGRGEFSRKKGNFRSVLPKLPLEARTRMLETLIYPGEESVKRLKESATTEEEKRFLSLLFDEAEITRLLGISDCGKREKIAKLTERVARRKND